MERSCLDYRARPSAYSAEDTTVAEVVAAYPVVGIAVAAGIAGAAGIAVAAAVVTYPAVDIVVEPDTIAWAVEVVEAAEA